MSLDTWSGGPPTPAEAADSDAWLWRVMQKDKNKEMIALLEDSLRAFLKDDAQTSLPFPPRSAFHRKVCYLVARRYGLAHRLEEHPDPPTGPAPAVRLVLIKTPHSAEPADRLAQLADRPPPDPTREVALRVNIVPVQKSVQDDDQTEQIRPTASSTTFLRRPRSADGKAARIVRAIPGSATQPAAATLKSFSEEDYRKARARIFKNADSQLDGRDPSEQGPITIETERNESVRNVKIAKGPVEGTTGFERRRNRRNATSQATQAATVDKLAKRGSSDRLSNSQSEGTGEASRQPGKSCQGQSRGAPSRGAPEQVSKQTPAASSSGMATGTNGSFVQTTPGNSGRRQNAYMATGNGNGDLQDPDFDRRYDKWAVRRAPPPPPHPTQQIPIPIFSQLLYPYAVQASAPHVHPSALHLGSVNSGSGQVQPGNVSANQYQSLQMHHAPSGAMMFQQLGQGIGGLAAEYNGRSVAMPGRMSPYDMTGGEQFGASHSREMSTLQHQAIPPPVGRKPSPAYGLDSTVDFPPLP